MTNIAAIAGKELKTYFTAPWAYIVTAIFLVITGYGFAWSSITYQQTTIQGFLGWGSFFLLFLAPALTMRLLAKEQEVGTIELLLTAPVRDIEVVAGKFLASLGILAAMLTLTLYYPLLLLWFGSPDWGPIASGYLGVTLLGAAFLSIGLFASSLTPNQIVALVLGIGVLSGLWFLGDATSFVSGTPGEVLDYLSLSSHFPSFGQGIIDTRGIVYYLSVIAVFLFLTVRSLETRRWR